MNPGVAAGYGRRFRFLCVDGVGGCLLGCVSTLTERTYEKIHYLCNDRLVRDDRCFDRRAGQVYSDGIQTKQQEIDSMQKWDMKSFALSDFNLVMTNADTALVTYHVKVEGTVEGKDASGTYNAGSIWQMKNGEWHPIFHTNTKEEKPAGQ